MSVAYAMFEEDEPFTSNLFEDDCRDISPVDNSPPREYGNEGPVANELDRDREEVVMAMISRKRDEAIARNVNLKAKTSGGDTNNALS